MKKCKVLVPFILGDTGELLKAGNEVEVTDDQLKRIQAVSPNMVEVLGDAKKPRTKKAE
jgi:hypothetical protein